MGISKTLIWLLVVGAVAAFTLATPIPDDSPVEGSQGVAVNNEDSSTDLQSQEDDELVDVADLEEEGRNLFGKIVQKVTSQGVKTAVKGVAKGTKKVIKKVAKGVIKGVQKGGKKVIKGAAKVVKEGAKKAIKGAKKVVKEGAKKVVKGVKSNIVKQGKKFIVKGVKQVAKVAAEELGEMAIEAVVNHVVNGGAQEDSDEEVYEEDQEGDEEGDEEAEEGEEEGEEEAEEGEEDEGMDLMEFVANDEHCSCPNSKKCECNIEVPGYEVAKMNVTLLGSLWEAESEIRIGAFYGDEKIMVNKFPTKEAHKKCRKIPESMGGVQMCISSNGKSDEGGLMKQCFNFEFDEESVVKCISQTKDFKLTIKTN